MTVIQTASYNSKLSKHLLKAILFFSIFTLIGHTGTGILQQQQAIKTELAVSRKPVFKRTTSYKRAAALLYRQNPFFYYSKKEVNAIILLHNRLAKIEFDTIAKQVYSFTAPNRFVLLKTLPQNTGGKYFNAHTA